MMMLLFIKNRRGFSLVELMLVIGIMSILAAITIPSYQNYLNEARLVKRGEDLRSLQKSILAFGTISDNYCKNSRGKKFSFENIGAGHLKSDSVYSPCSGSEPEQCVLTSQSDYYPGFIGFTSTDCTGVLAADYIILKDAAVAASNDCKLESYDFIVGSATVLGSKEWALSMNNNGVYKEQEFDFSGTSKEAVTKTCK